MSATRLTGLYAVLAAAAAVFFSPLLALSYFATADGAQELETGTVSAWADPARDIVGGLLTWASARPGLLHLRSGIRAPVSRRVPLRPGGQGPPPDAR